MVSSFKKFIILSLICINSIFANSYLDGEGRFYAHEGDSLNFIKGQLLYSATRQVLTQEMKKLNLNSELFWEKFDEKFNTYFESVQENLHKKFKMDAEKVSAKQRTAYTKALRKKRLAVKEEYGNLKRVLTRYAVKRMSRSTRDPNSRYIRIQAQVNRRKLQQIYLKFVTENTKRSFSKLFVSMDFRLESMSWEDTGVAVGDDFVKALRNHWKNDLQEMLSEHFSEIEFTDKPKESELIEFSKLKAETKESLTSEESENGPLHELKDSLWMRLSFNFKKVADNMGAKTKKFVVSSDYLLIDMATKKLVDFNDFGPIEKEYKYKDQRELSSHFASFVYQIPKSRFQMIPNQLASLPVVKNRAIIKVWDYKNLNSLLELQKVFIDRGIKYQFNTSIESMDKEKASVLLEYIGEFEEVKNQLFSLENLKLKTGEIVSFKNNQDPFSLSLVHEKIE